MASLCASRISIVLICQTSRAGARRGEGVTDCTPSCILDCYSNKARAIVRGSARIFLLHTRGRAKVDAALGMLGLARRGRAELDAARRGPERAAAGCRTLREGVRRPADLGAGRGWCEASVKRLTLVAG